MNEFVDLAIGAGTYVVPVLVGGVLLGIPIWKAHKMRQAAREPVRDDVCVACQSARVTVLAPGVYQCGACGFTGGSGMSAYVQQQRRQQIATLTGSQRFEQAVRQLHDARHALLGVEGFMADGVVQSAMDIVGLGSPWERGQAKQTSMRAATGEMLRAEKLVREACEMLDRAHLEDGFAPIDFSSLEHVLDVNIAADSLLVDAIVHVQLEDLRSQARSMLTVVETLLAQVSSIPTNVPVGPSPLSHAHSQSPSKQSS